VTPAHVIFIPAVLLLGFVLGWTFGARGARAEYARREKERRE
jgi:hypothetical protein